MVALMKIREEVLRWWGRGVRCCCCWFCWLVRVSDDEDGVKVVFRERGGRVERGEGGRPKGFVGDGMVWLSFWRSSCEYGGACRGARVIVVDFQEVAV
jgi:hypothetical protein